jgi:hypothetical protein
MISGSTGLSGWHFGRYEHRMGVLCDTTLDWGSSEAVCKLKDRSQTKLKVPTKYIKPLHPTGVGEQVVVIRGENIGMDAIVHSTAEGSRWELAALHDHMKVVGSEFKERLCLLAIR